MKKHIILGGILLLSLTIYSYDGAGGASLNRSQTIEEYDRLVDLSDQAVNTGDKKTKEEAIEGIEDFLQVIEDYEAISSSGAKSYLDMYEKDLIEKLQLLKGFK